MLLRSGCKLWLRRRRGGVSTKGGKTKDASAHEENVRVRFAPSPTGYLHVGGARTALFNWLYAKQKNGSFVLRVEDTDTERCTPAAEQMMMHDLRWLGLYWDEGPDIGGPCGPYRQSERSQIYTEYANTLVHQGLAYPCFCSEEELDQMRKDAEARGSPPKYDGRWANADRELVQQKLAAGEPHVYRFRVPPDTDVTVHDMVRGPVTWNTENLGDFVIMRSNGLPVYNFCVAIDDALMGITHVLRAEEHLTNTLRQKLVYQGLNLFEPHFGHLSLILAHDKTKLSKRHGATSVNDFREEGFLPEAMLNFLSLLGWNDGTDQEVYATDELIERFDIGRINKSPAVFDREKLTWLNGQKLRSFDDSELAETFGDQWKQEGILAPTVSAEAVEIATRLVREQADLVRDCISLLRPIFGYTLEDTLESNEAQDLDTFSTVAKEALRVYETGELEQAVQESGGFKRLLNGIGKAHGLKGRRLFMPMRISFTGSMMGPDIGLQLRYVL